MLEMKKDKGVKKEISYIPFRYILAIFLTILEIAMIVAILLLLIKYIPYFSIAVLLTQIAVVLAIISSSDNPEYKIPWLLCVILLPIIGFMLYFLFHQRKLSKKFIHRFHQCQQSLNYNDHFNQQQLKKENALISSQAFQLCQIANTHLYKDTQLYYFETGEKMFEAMTQELKKAKKFIFLEFFIIEKGICWNSILNILKQKIEQQVEVRIIYDDIGCMKTLPSQYYQQLKEMKMDAVLFSKLKGQADSEFNNRSHRKIMIIDGKIGFTGGMNLADEYINVISKYGYWKDCGILLKGQAVNEMTKLFLTDYYLNSKSDISKEFKYYCKRKKETKERGYVIPFGDGPKPIYEKNVGKTVLMNMLYQATNYVYMTTPYLILDNEMMKAIENAALRGVDVRMIVPHIPDKKLVFEMTKSNYQFLMKSNVKIYEYEPGFIHAKSYICDDEVAMIGTINLDYRSLTHHFENGVWIYKNDVIFNMKKDFLQCVEKSIYMNERKRKEHFYHSIIRAFIRIFSPLL